LSAVTAFCALGMVNCGFFRDSSNEPVAKTALSAEENNFPSMTPEQWLNLSLTRYQHHKYLESIAAAQTAVYLHPNNAEAYNNMGAAYASLHLWDLAIQADVQALHCRPDFPLARNNLLWATEQKRLGVH
jgi:protein O-mannosyl-transferase